ncbi:methyltransferase, UbiE/COQ5 domain protein [Leptospira interrogans serovar Bataviae str. HAI135]|nr:methyltransferase, UbiE/COQ5 domain protein [Leptospira interrogans serovar Bataviae str. HAI135]
MDCGFLFFRIVPILGYILWGGKNEMFDYLPVSSLSYPNQETLKSLLEKEGFQEVEYKNFVLETQHFISQKNLLKKHKNFLKCCQSHKNIFLVIKKTTIIPSSNSMERLVLFVFYFKL